MDTFFIGHFYGPIVDTLELNLTRLAEELISEELIFAHLSGEEDYFFFSWLRVSLTRPVQILDLQSLLEFNLAVSWADSYITRLSGN